MAESTPHPFYGVETTHPSGYSVRRQCYFWDVSGLKGKLDKIRVRVSLRSSENIKNSIYNLCLFTDWKKPDGNNNWGWHKRNKSTWYQYPEDSEYYFNKDTYSSFGTFLCNKPVSLNITGGAGNTWQILDVIPDSKFLDASKWNKTIYLMFYDTTGKNNPNLIWGREEKISIAFYTFDGPQSYVHRYSNGSWRNDCLVHIYDSTEERPWVLCNVWRYNGNTNKWELIGSPAR